MTVGLILVCIILVINIYMIVMNIKSGHELEEIIIGLNIAKEECLKCSKTNNPVREEEKEKVVNDINTVNGFEEKLEGMVDNWRNEEKEKEIVNRCISVTFDSLDDFLNYIANHNTKIIDVKNKKVCNIINIEKKVYNNKKTVLITFDDNYRAIFVPNLYAKYIKEDPIEDFEEAM